MKQHYLRPRITIQPDECRPLAAADNYYKAEQQEIKLEDKGRAISLKVSCSK